MNIKFIMTIWILLALHLSGLNSVFASDHIDGPVTSAHAQSDITDLYLFHSPETSNFITVVMNSHPLMPSNGHFEEKILYTFRFRAAEIKADKIISDKSSQKDIFCSFHFHGHGDESDVICESDGLFKISGQTEQVIQNNNVKLWTGMRSDPFFFSADWATSASNDGVLLKPQTSNIMDQLNILSIVLEFDPRLLFPGYQGLIGVVAETWSKDSKGQPDTILDRVGRPEITNVSLVKHGTQTDLRDEYNSVSSFEVSEAQKKIFTQRLQDNILNHYNGLEGEKFWTASSSQKLADLFAEDFLVFDLSSSCAGTNFLSIEKQLILNQPNSSCGGRALTDDIMDEMFSLYITGGKQQLSDGIDYPYRKVSSSFPYLAEPDTGFSARVKAFIARTFFM